jgi:hypothetical protein
MQINEQGVETIWPEAVINLLYGTLLAHFWKE